MDLDELTGDITEMVISWKTKDSEKGHLLFKKVIGILERAAGPYAAQVYGKTVGDAVNGAYLIVKRADPKLFDSRGSFFALYVQAMGFWLKEQRRLRRTQRRNGEPLPLLGDPTAAEQKPLMTMLMQLDEGLELLKRRDIITDDDAKLFLANKIFGVTQTDLADMYGTTRDKVGETVRFVRKVLKREFGEFATD